MQFLDDRFKARARRQRTDREIPVVILERA